MAPRLPTTKLDFIRESIDTQSFNTSQVAAEAECSKATINNFRKNSSQIQFAIISRTIVQYLA